MANRRKRFPDSSEAERAVNINEAIWRKSSYSGGAQSSECVEVAALDVRAGVRDTKDRDRGHLEVQPASWRALLGAIKG
jgi:hypothetical protein